MDFIETNPVFARLAVSAERSASVRLLESVPMETVLAHQRPKRADYPPAGIALETLADPHWSELSAYLVELESADAADIFLYWEYRTLLRGWGRTDFQPEYTVARLNVGEPEVGAALHKHDKGKRQDLRGVEGMEPILVSVATSGMPLTVTDGNLRLVNQYTRFSLDGFRAFLCVHPRLGSNRDNQWFITARAHEVAQLRMNGSCDERDDTR